MPQLTDLPIMRFAGFAIFMPPGGISHSACQIVTPRKSGKTFLDRLSRIADIAYSISDFVR